MRSMLLMLFVVATLPMTFVEPFIGLLLWVLFSDMNPYRYVWGLAAEIHWVYLIAVVTIFATLLHANKLQRLRWDVLTGLMLTFVLFTAVTSYFSVVPPYAWLHWEQFAKVITLSCFIILMVDSRKRMDLLIWVFVVSFAFWGVKGGVFTVLHGGHYIVKGPIKSFYYDRNMFALAMCMTLPLMRYLQLQARSRRVKLGLWLGMALMVLSIIGTYSRGGLIALVAVMLALVWKSRQRFRLLLVGAALLPLMLIFMPAKWTNRMQAVVTGQAELSQSFQERVQSWEFATNLGLHHPVLGGGFGVWISPYMWERYGPPTTKHRRAVHDVLFQVLAEQGVVGLCLYVLMLLIAWVHLSRVRRLARSDPETMWMYDLSGFIQVCLIAFLVAGSALPDAYFNFLFQLYAVIVLLRRFALESRVATQAGVAMSGWVAPGARSRALAYSSQPPSSLGMEQEELQGG